MEHGNPLVTVDVRVAGNHTVLNVRIVTAITNIHLGIEGVNMTLGSLLGQHVDILNAGVGVGKCIRLNHLQVAREGVGTERIEAGSRERQIGIAIRGGRGRIVLVLLTVIATIVVSQVTRVAAGLSYFIACSPDVVYRGGKVRTDDLNVRGDTDFLYVVMGNEERGGLLHALRLRNNDILQRAWVDIYQGADHNIINVLRAIDFCIFQVEAHGAGVITREATVRCHCAYIDAIVNASALVSISFVEHQMPISVKLSLSRSEVVSIDMA